MPYYSSSFPSSYSSSSFPSFSLTSLAFFFCFFSSQRFPSLVSYDFLLLFPESDMNNHRSPFPEDNMYDEREREISAVENNTRAKVFENNKLETRNLIFSHLAVLRMDNYIA